MRKSITKLSLSRETLRALEGEDLRDSAGGASGQSRCVCAWSVQTYGCVTVEYVESCAVCSGDPELC